MRALTAGMQTQVQNDSLRPIILFEGEFLSGMVRLWSGYGTLSWNGVTWSGVGELAGISPIAETSETRATGVTISLSGIPNDLIAKALDETRQGKQVKIWFGTTDEEVNVIADPYLSFAGRIDVPTIDEGRETSTISITVESRMIDLQRARERRYTHEDQQRDFPGDRGFEYVPMVQDWSGTWGKGNSGGSGGGSGVGGDPRHGGGCVLEGTLIEPLIGEAEIEFEEENEWFCIITNNGFYLVGNREHPVYTRWRGEVRLPDISIGDELITRRGIAGVAYKGTFSMKARKAKVSVPCGNLYWANGILSHNKRDPR